jgi:ABC-2 type transport system permease protein
VISQFLLLTKHYLRRSSRDWISLGAFIVLPVVIVGILNFIYNGKEGYDFYFNGYNIGATHISIHMVLLFQLNGGLYLMNFVNYDLLGAMKWRYKSAPVGGHLPVFAAAFACTLFTTFQGVLIVVVTAWLFQVYWGSIGLSILILFFVSLISQFICLLLLLTVRSIGGAEGLSWLITVAMSALGGMMFSLPDNSFFRFISTYGTPYSLARNAILETGFLGTGKGYAGYLAGLLFILGLLAIATVPLGRRKLV